MRASRLILPVLVLLAACDTNAKTQLRALAHADSLRTDSLLSVKNDLLDELTTSTQFVNDINAEMAKLRSHPTERLSAKLSSESDMAAVKEERAAVVGKIQELVARLDSSEARLAATRARAAALSKRDARLVAQVDAYEQTIAGLRATIEQQKADYQAIIDKQNAEIDTLKQVNVQLAGERTALTDTVGQLTTEKNTVYYVTGTRDELERLGVLAEEGHRRFLILGGRTLVPSRSLDATKFTRIDRLRDRTITLPAGEYTIFSRQNPQYATPFASKDGKISGGLRIDQPERFWESSRYLILVR